MSRSELSKNYEPTEVERRWYAHWQERGYFAPRDGEGPPFVILIPPPNVTGSLHFGHTFDHTIQDLLTRWHRMMGEPTLWLPGTDHAGIATQNVVEKRLAEQGKTRHDVGREGFVEEVWRWKSTYHARITEQMRRLGDSVDWSRERFTMDEGLSRAVREVFVRLHRKGLIYRGNRIINWCPRCRTALSDEEVNHVDTDGKLYYIQYPIKDSKKSVTVATTRPETMLGDTAVAVHPADQRYAPMHGKTLVLPFLGREIPIILDDTVDAKFGTGAVKVTPAHDPNDFEMGKRHDLPFITVMDEGAVMNENAGGFQGLSREEARTRIVDALKDRGLLARVEPHRHSVGHCDRCDTVVEPYLSLQWFVKMKPLAEPAYAAIEKGELTILPRRWEKVYLRWLEGIRDWCISRQLWWGHRIPVWTCAACKEEIVAVETPHACPKCGGADLVQDPDVLDTWFSSWLWPFSTLGWPEETEDLKRFYPSSVMVTGPDIIFFWVARMVMAGYEFMGKCPFPVVFLHGIVRDAQGRKLSKSLGNSSDPIELMDRFGADSLRYSLVLLSPQGADIHGFSDEKVDLGRHFANKLWNAFRLVQPHLDGFAPDEAKAKGHYTDEDLWILSTLATTVRSVTRNMRAYRIGDAAKDIYDFVWRELCDWYLEMAKPRLYAEAGTPDAIAVRTTIHTVFGHVLRLLHPFMPFMTEELWHALPGTEGDVATAEWPAPARGSSHPEAEARIALLKEIVGSIRNLRSEMNVAPARKAAILIRASEPDATTLRHQHDLILLLGKGESLEVGPEVAKPRITASAVVRQHEIFLPLEGLIDVELERQRLRKEYERVVREFESSHRKLQNDDFLAKAKKEVVEREREKFEALGETKEKLQRNLEVLG
ncbi:MAG TPA: valine--tRNA ligase [Candidatus Eisenbacteria bacterium]|nr:valine--tRNA ligase [Candidatus Eisenbacteria bacterium]